MPFKNMFPNDYFCLDEKGIPITDHSLIRIFHFTGARRKKHYMYKLVRIIDGKWYGYHLDSQNSRFRMDNAFRIDEEGHAQGVVVLQGSCV